MAGCAAVAQRWPWHSYGRGTAARAVRRRRRPRHSGGDGPAVPGATRSSRSPLPTPVTAARLRVENVWAPAQTMAAAGGPTGRREARGRHSWIPVTSERKSPRVSKPALESGQDAPSPRKQLTPWLPGVTRSVPGAAGEPEQPGAWDRAPSPWLRRAAPAAPRGTRATDAEGPRWAAGHAGGATGVPRARGAMDVARPPLVGRARSRLGGTPCPPASHPPTPRHRPDLPASGRGGSAAAVPGELFPGHAVGRAAEVRSDHKPPKAFFPKLSCKAAPGAGVGVGGQPGMGGTLVAEPPGGSGGSRAGPVAPDTAAGAAVSDGPVSSGEQSPIPPSGPIPGARVRARPGRSRGGQARTWHWGQSSPVCGQGREQATAGGHRPGQAACNPDRQHLTLPCAPSRGAFAAPRGGRPLPTASPGVLEWVMLQGTRTDTSVSPGCWHLTLPWPGR